jgi:hypothetical protein
MTISSCYDADLTGHSDVYDYQTARDGIRHKIPCSPNHLCAHVCHSSDWARLDVVQKRSRLALGTTGHETAAHHPWRRRFHRTLWLILYASHNSQAITRTTYNADRSLDSLSYLPVSDATIITFLVPTLTAFVCWVVLSVRSVQV